VNSSTPELCQFCANQEAIITYDAFEKEMQEVLGRMFDPDYQPSAAVCLVLGSFPSEGSAVARSKIQAAIEGLKPPANAPQSAFPRLMYELLVNRYVHKLTQEETAYRINVSRRTVNRLQRMAVQTLCEALWERGGMALQNESKPSTTEQLPATPAADWSTQLQQELSHLETRGGKTLSNVDEVISNALTIVNAPQMGFEGNIHTLSIQPGLIAAVHPVLLEQVLISALKRLVPIAGGRSIAIYAKLVDGDAQITLTCPCQDAECNIPVLLDEIPSSRDIRLKAAKEGQQAFLWITMPSEGNLTVLVVDDNEDLVQFYRDCTIGSRYHIVHQAQGRNLLQVVGEVRPDLIVLDVMLPDIDGWRLLMRLHETRETRGIPVLVCSVIREEGLSVSLGAAGFLAKPVSPRQFLEALDQIQPQGAAKGPTAPASSVGSG
jgi:CheY-like chemotaxis protein